MALKLSKVLPGDKKTCVHCGAGFSTGKCWKNEDGLCFCCPGCGVEYAQARMNMKRYTVSVEAREPRSGHDFERREFTVEAEDDHDARLRAGQRAIDMGLETRGVSVLREDRMNPRSGSGYVACVCRDCMETAISSDSRRPEFCSACKEAGCEIDTECRVVDPRENGSGEREFKTYKAWRSACSEFGPVRFEGDVDICQALYTDGRAGGPGEWDGERGIIYVESESLPRENGMGGHEYGTPSGPASLTRVKLDRGGYDSHGSYWGVGEPLWTLVSDDSQHFIRAADRAEAAELFGKKFPGLKLARSNPDEQAVWDRYVRADDEWSRHLEGQFRKRAGDVRYTSEGHGKPGTPLRVAHDAYVKARDAWNELSGQEQAAVIRRFNPAEKTPLQVGDRVVYTKSFLRNTGASATDDRWFKVGPIVGIGSTARTWHCGKCDAELGYMAPINGDPELGYNVPVSGALSPCHRATIVAKDHLPRPGALENIVRVKFDGENFETSVNSGNLGRKGSFAANEEITRRNPADSRGRVTFKPGDHVQVEKLGSGTQSGHTGVIVTPVLRGDGVPKAEGSYSPFDAKREVMYRDDVTGKLEVMFKNRLTLIGSRANPHHGYGDDDETPAQKERMRKLKEISDAAMARDNPHVGRNGGKGYIAVHSPSGKETTLEVVRHKGQTYSSDGSPLPGYSKRVVYETKAEALQSHKLYGCDDCTTRVNPNVIPSMPAVRTPPKVSGGRHPAQVIPQVRLNPFSKEGDYFITETRDNKVVGRATSLENAKQIAEDAAHQGKIRKWKKSGAVQPDNSTIWSWNTDDADVMITCLPAARG